MTLALDLDALLQRVTDIAGTISGIRHAYNYDEWPDSPPGMMARDQAMHFTGYPGEEEPILYRRLGIDMNEYEFVVPMYTAVVSAAQIKRSRNWVQAYFDRYPAKFASSIQLDGLISSGSALYTGARIVRAIPEYPGFDGYYIVRHSLEIHLKGHVEHGA